MPCTSPPALPRPLALLAALAVLAVLGTGCARRPPATSVPLPGQPGRGVPATVARVVDGDTVVLLLAGEAERARLLGIDTPETVKPDSPVECFGPEASARTKDLLAPGTPVLVQRDEEARDRFGRLLVYLWRRQDGLFVNQVLVAEGLARPLSIAPNTSHRSDLAGAAARARAGGLGLWASCPAESPRPRAGAGAGP